MTGRVAADDAQVGQSREPQPPPLQLHLSTLRGMDNLLTARLPPIIVS